MAIETADRPLISFVVLAYNQEKYIREAIKGAFSQTYSPLEIILSDDCSQDRTFDIIQEMAAAHAGPHSVTVNRNEQNLGIAGHINRVAGFANGDFIVTAGGDDIAYPRRVAETVSAWRENPKAKAIYFSFDCLYESGIRHFSWRPRRELHNPKMMVPFAGGKIVGASAAWHRDLFDLFGPLTEPHAVEDKVLGFRAALCGDIVFVDIAVVNYRIHDGGAGQSLGRRHPDQAELRRRRITVAHQRVSALNCFKHDLAVALKNGLVSQAECGELRNAIDESLRKHHLILKWQAGKYSERLNAATRLLVEDVETWPQTAADKVWMWACALLPPLEDLTASSPFARWLNNCRILVGITTKDSDDQ